MSRKQSSEMLDATSLFSFHVFERYGVRVNNLQKYNLLQGVGAKVPRHLFLGLCLFIGSSAFEQEFDLLEEVQG